ncbi:MAG: IS110 family transposase [Desulfobacterales bacterium]|nr:IS110 family transposase [Desulfobacterales bacterium]
MTACNLVAEIGVNMNQFPTAQHLASRAAVCPGNHESAGKRKSGRTRDGTAGCAGRFARQFGRLPERRTAICQRTKKLAARRGVKRAVMVVAHTICLLRANATLKTGQDYHELGGNYLEQINKSQLQRYFTKRLQNSAFR